MSLYHLTRRKILPRSEVRRIRLVRTRIRAVGRVLSDRVFFGRELASLQGACVSVRCLLLTSADCVAIEGCGAGDHAFVELSGVG